MTWIAVTGHGSWGGPNKYHAAKAGSGEQVFGSIRYTSRCGQKFLFPVRNERRDLGHPRTEDEAVPFDGIMHIEQCQRCATLVAKGEPGARGRCRGKGTHIGNTQGGARWRNRGTCPVCGKNLALTKSGRIPEHVPKVEGT